MLILVQVNVSIQYWSPASRHAYTVLYITGLPGHKFTFRLQVTSATLSFCVLSCTCIARKPKGLPMFVYKYRLMPAIIAFTSKISIFVPMFEGCSCFCYKQQSATISFFSVYYVHVCSENPRPCQCCLQVSPVKTRVPEM